MGHWAIHAGEGGVSGAYGWGIFGQEVGRVDWVILGPSKTEKRQCEEGKVPDRAGTGKGDLGTH